MSVFPPIVGFEQRVQRLTSIGKRCLQIPETPAYLYDAYEVEANLQRFTGAFEANGVKPAIFYAVKSNPHPMLLQTVIKSGHGLDVSSFEELSAGLRAGASRLVYTGPGKSERDLQFACEHAGKITFHLESFHELGLLSRISSERGIRVRCGVRIATSHQSAFSKFGIPLTELKRFWTQAAASPGIDLCGIHFHLSWLADAQPVIGTIETLRGYFQEELPEAKASLKFLDIGGGIYPESFEAQYSWNPDQYIFYTEEGYIDKILRDEYSPRYLPIDSTPVERIASAICRSIADFRASCGSDIEIFAEPGRFISHSSMHLLLSVLDSKDSTSAIVDGGTNMIGWDRLAYLNYVPIFNLAGLIGSVSASPHEEQPFVTYGPLCTPDDIWGYYLIGERPKIGDKLLIPYQGAYTFTLAQNFIRAVPPVFELI